MKSFIKKLVEKRKEEITVLIYDEQNPHLHENFSIHPGKMFLLLGGINVAIIIVIMLILFVTPLGTILFNKEDRALRSSVLEVRERISAMQDSLNVRDQQLEEIQRVIRENADTSFSLQSNINWETIYGRQHMSPEVITYQVSERPERRFLSSEQILNSGLYSEGIIFPLESPVNGSITSDFNPGKGHYGMDIAARKGADVRAVADGIVVSSDWTINNGYVMHILHGDGFVTIYKHFSEVLYKAGDKVKKSDIIGKVGETGLLATGPHIHFEMWKNRSPIDPAQYINLY